MRAKDDRYIAKARETIVRRFPRMPLKSVEIVLQHSFEKGSGRVGRSTTLIDERKIMLAVRAHARHTRTRYETILKSLENGKLGREAIREEARSRIKRQLDGIVSSWEAPNQPNLKASREAKIKAKHSLSTRHVREGSEDSAIQIINKTATQTTKCRSSSQAASLATSIHAPPSGQKRLRTMEEEAIMPKAKRSMHARDTAQTNSQTIRQIHLSQDLNQRQPGKPARDEESEMDIEAKGGYDDCVVLWESPVEKPKYQTTRKGIEARTEVSLKQEAADDPIEILDLSITRSSPGPHRSRHRKPLQPPK